MPEPFPIAGERFYAETAREDAVLDALGRGAQLQAPPFLLVIGGNAVTLHQIAVVISGSVVGIGCPVRIEGIPVRITERAGETGVERQAPFLSQGLGIVETCIHAVGCAEAVEVQVQCLIDRTQTREGPFPAGTVRVAMGVVNVGRDGATIIAPDALVAATATDAETPLYQVGALRLFGTVQESGGAGEVEASEMALIGGLTL